MFEPLAYKENEKNEEKNRFFSRLNSMELFKEVVLSSKTVIWNGARIFKSLAYSACVV